MFGHTAAQLSPDTPTLLLIVYQQLNSSLCRSIGPHTFPNHICPLEAELCHMEVKCAGVKVFVLMPSGKQEVCQCDWPVARRYVSSEPIQVP